jgi:hypothetical protein
MSPTEESTRSLEVLPHSQPHSGAKIAHAEQKWKSSSNVQINTTVEECVDNLIHKLNLVNYRQGFLASKFGCELK